MAAAKLYGGALSKRTPKTAARARELPSKPTLTTIDRGPAKGQRRQVRGSINDAIDATAARVVRAFVEAEQTGRTAAQVNLYKSTKMVDGRLGSVCNARILGIVGRPIVWKPPPGFESDATAKENAQFISRLWNSQRGILKTVGHLAHGVLEGHALGELHYEPDASTGWITARIEPIRANRLMWVDGKPVFLQDEQDPESAGIPLDRNPDKWIFHAPGAGVSDHPWRLGAIRSRIIPSTIKRFAARAWIQLLERWGQPQLVAECDPDSNPDVTADRLSDDVVEALALMSSDWRIAVPKGTKITAIPVSVSDALHKTFIDAQNVEDAIALLGQNLTTEVTAGGFAATVAHGHVRRDILAADWLELGETLTDQWAANLIRFNRPGTPVPYAEAVLNPKRELTATEYQAGLFSRNAVALSMGHEAEPGEDRYSPLAAVALGSLATGEASPSAPSVSGPGASTADKPVGVVPVAAAPVADPAADVAPADAPDAPPEKAADTALTGIQSERLEAIVLNVISGVYPASIGKLLVKGTFPSLDAAFVADLIDSAAAAKATAAPPENPSATAPTPAL